jgi:hypothetical protein
VRSGYVKRIGTTGPQRRRTDGTTRYQLVKYTGHFAPSKTGGDVNERMQHLRAAQKKARQKQALKKTPAMPLQEQAA